LADFDGDRLKSTDTIPVLFYAEWCPFCRSFYAEFDEALNHKGVRWAEVDISDDDNPLWERFGISIVPTVIVFRDGQLVFRRDGVRGRGLPKKAIDETLQEIETNVTH
jgi:thioredoxin 1